MLMQAFPVIVLLFLGGRAGKGHQNVTCDPLDSTDWSWESTHVARILTSSLSLSEVSPLYPATSDVGHVSYQRPDGIDGPWA